jgi:hypothetical protein
LIAALLPWRLAKQDQPDRPLARPPTLPKYEPSKAVAANPGRLKVGPIWKTPTDYQLAIRILQYPDTLHEYMKQGSRPYYIWEPQTDWVIEQETEMLQNILAQYENAKFHSSRAVAEEDLKKPLLKMVFVHVANLQTLYKFDRYIERMQKFDLMFAVFGNHPLVDQRLWGTREIYPIGLFQLAYHQW